MSTTLRPAAPWTFKSAPTTPPLFLGIMPAVQHGCINDSVMVLLMYSRRAASVWTEAPGFTSAAPNPCMVGVLSILRRYLLWARYTSKSIGLEPVP